MKRRHRLTRYLLLLPPLLLAGCGLEDMGELEAYAHAVKARPPRPVKPLPEIEPIRTFVYEPGERRDPFTPDAQTEPEEPIAPVSELAPDLTRRKEELEGYALDSLRMVGTLEQNGTRYGLVRTKEGILHRVTTGNYMGMNNGQITNVGGDAIQLTEIVSDAPGQWRERAATLALTK